MRAVTGLVAFHARLDAGGYFNTITLGGSDNLLGAAHHGIAVVYITGVIGLAVGRRMLRNEVLCRLDSGRDFITVFRRQVFAFRLSKLRALNVALDDLVLSLGVGRRFGSLSQIGQHSAGARRPGRGSFRDRCKRAERLGWRRLHAGWRFGYLRGNFLLTFRRNP